MHHASRIIETMTQLCACAHARRGKPAPHAAQPSLALSQRTRHTRSDKETDRRARRQWGRTHARRTTRRRRKGDRTARRDARTDRTAPIASSARCGSGQAAGKIQVRRRTGYSLQVPQCGLRAACCVLRAARTHRPPPRWRSGIRRRSPYPCPCPCPGPCPRLAPYSRSACVGKTEMRAIRTRVRGDTKRDVSEGRDQGRERCD